MTPREDSVEDYLVARCRDEAILCFKFSSPSRRAVPDRILMGHDANGHPVTLFIEVKRPGGKPRADQYAMLSNMRDHGAHAVVADSRQQVDRLLSDYFTAPTVPPHERDPHDAPLPGEPSNLIVGL